MDLNKISNFIKAKRKELGITQDELAKKLFVTEKFQDGKQEEELQIYLYSFYYLKNLK